MSDPRGMRAPSGVHDDRPLERADLLEDPIDQFRAWLGEAEDAGVPLPNAMALATADRHARPTVRHVLLRGVDRHGFQFFTNRESRKGQQLRENPRASLVFLWRELDRQVHADGPVTELSDTASDEYFATRPREAQLGAWASPQSAIIDDRQGLEARLLELAERFPGPVPRPEFWGGYVVAPETIEFWQGRRHRLHDRFVYTARGDDWTIARLAP